MLTKIKHSKGETEIWWKEENDQKGETVEHKLVSSDPPRPELVESLQQFSAYVIDVCELPTEYASGLNIIGVSISFSEALGMGLVVTSLKKVTKANAPVVINTPHLSQDASSDGGPHWPAYVERLLVKLEEEATLYRTGRRAQGDLPLEEVAAEEPAEHPAEETPVSTMPDAELETYFRAHINDDPLKWPDGATEEQCERILTAIHSESEQVSEAHV